MSRSSQARRERRARVANGIRLEKPRRSLFRTVEIREAVEGEVRDQRQQLAARRNRLPPELVTDEERRGVAKRVQSGWAFDHESDRPTPTETE